MKSLSQLSVLAIDCQATHNNPSSGHLVEIGWIKTQAASIFDHEIATETAKSYLLKMGNTAQIPRQFLTITGITAGELKEAVSKKIVWHKLFQEAKKTKSKNQGICPAVIHFKRYEEPYLIHLYQEFAPQKKFPFTIICTHELISRLFPGLPRKSLRAVAGFFGYSLPNLRRSLHHVVATAFIWNRIVRILEKKEKVVTFKDLQDWLSRSPTPILRKHPKRVYPMEKSLRRDLPDKPGIYRMYRSSGDLLYIGKAKSLKYRVNSYFHNKGSCAEHILEMLSQAQDLTTTVTDTALEAAVRESDEIKLLSPPYNRALRSNDRKLFFYSKNFRSKHPEPNIHHPLGPFPSNINMESLEKLMDILNRKIHHFSQRLIETLLDTPPRYAPDKECFQEGLEDFRNKYSNNTQPPIELGHIMQWGTEFWKEKLLEKEQEQQQKESDRDGDIFIENEEQEKKEARWTPERVSRALKRKIRIGSFHMRRARWFCRLSESLIAWSNGADDNPKHILLIDNGVPIFRENNLCAYHSVIPAGHGKSLLERQENFDIATYDRMRVVTTEMRRIIQEGQNIELCFHPGIILKTAQLEKILRWI